MFVTTSADSGNLHRHLSRQPSGVLRRMRDTLIHTPSLDEAQRLVLALLTNILADREAAPIARTA